MRYKLQILEFDEAMQGSFIFIFSPLFYLRQAGCVREIFSSRLVNRIFIYCYFPLFSSSASSAVCLRATTVIFLMARGLTVQFDAIFVAPFLSISFAFNAKYRIHVHVCQNRQARHTRLKRTEYRISATRQSYSAVGSVGIDEIKLQILRKSNKFSLASLHRTMPRTAQGNEKVFVSG